MWLDNSLTKIDSVSTWTWNYTFKQTKYHAIHLLFINLLQNNWKPLNMEWLTQQKQKCNAQALNLLLYVPFCVWQSDFVVNWQFNVSHNLI